MGKASVFFGISCHGHVTSVTSRQEIAPEEE
jgi:hypothetical protein